jgi:hypothetical protein
MVRAYFLSWYLFIFVLLTNFFLLLGRARSMCPVSSAGVMSHNRSQIRRQLHPVEVISVFSTKTLKNASKICLHAFFTFLRVNQKFGERGGSYHKSPSPIDMALLWSILQWFVFDLFVLDSIGLDGNTNYAAKFFKTLFLYKYLSIKNAGKHWKIHINDKRILLQDKA